MVWLCAAGGRHGQGTGEDLSLLLVREGGGTGGEVLRVDQAELDRYWNALLQGGGKAQACGWLMDRFGLRWQIQPAVLEQMMSDKDAVRAKRVTDAMLQMVKLDVAALEKAYRG